MLKDIFGQYSEKELKKILDNKTNYTCRYFIVSHAKGVLYEKIKRIDKGYFSKVYYYDQDTSFTDYQYIGESVIKNCVPFTHEMYVKESMCDLKHIDANKAIYTIACNHYGKDRVDLKNNELIIYYPEITVESENGLSHIITDVYININIDKNDKRLIPVRFIRASQTSSEIRRGYLFSHVSGGIKKTHDFCFGGANTPMARLTHDSSFTNKEWITNARFFFHVLDSYLSWESISGTPYREISKVINDDLWYKPVRNIKQLSLEEYSSYVSQIFNKLTTIDFEYTGVYNIRLYSSTKTAIEEIMEEIFLEEHKDLLYLGEVIEIKHDELYPTLAEKYDENFLLHFKGNDIFFKVIDSDPELNLEKQVPNIIKNDIISIIENKIKMELWKKHQSQ
jgi:hypothetical protein